MSLPRCRTAYWTVCWRQVQRLWSGVTREPGESYGVRRTRRYARRDRQQRTRRARRRDRQGCVYLSPKGSTANGPNKTKRNAEVALYQRIHGKKNQPPRPFHARRRRRTCRPERRYRQQAGKNQKFNDYLDVQGTVRRKKLWHSLEQNARCSLRSRPNRRQHCQPMTRQ